MAVKFVPTGDLDVNTDPSRLPSQIIDRLEVSGAMTRCTNLDTDQPGIAKTRYGSSKINTSAIDQTTPHLVVEMADNRCIFAGTKAYWNEAEFASGLTSARWSAIKYNSFNVTTQSIFATNGTERIRIPSDSTINQKYDYAYTHSWEADEVSGTTYQLGTTRNSIQCLYDWEEGSDESIDDSVIRRYMWFFEAVIAYNWGIDIPEFAPILRTLGAASNTVTSGIHGYAYTHAWEGTYHAKSDSYQFGATREGVTISTSYERITSGNLSSGFVFSVEARNYETRSLFQCLYDWEQATIIADSATYRHTWSFEGITDYDDKGRIGVCYTYCRKSADGVLECESNPSRAEYTEAQAILSAFWGLAEDPQITHVRLYRTLAGDATFYYANEYEINKLSGVVTPSDFALGAAVERDHDRPPAGAVVAGPTYNGYCFMLKDNLLYFCKPNQPEYWPADYYIEVGPPQEPLNGIEFSNGIPYVASEEEIYMIQGSGADSFFPLPMKAKTGTQAHIGMLSVKGLGIVHTDIDGFYGFTGNEQDEKVSESRFGPLFKGETKGSIPAVNRTYMQNCWFLFFDNKLWFGYPDSTAVYPNNVLIINTVNSKGRHYSYAQQFGAVTIDNTNNRILALDTTGFLRRLDDPDVTTDDGTSISWQIESKAFTDQLYKYFPRRAKYDVTIDTGGTATASILLDDTAIQTHSLTVSRQTKNRLIDGKNGDRLGVRIAGTGTASIRLVEVE